MNGLLFLKIVLKTLLLFITTNLLLLFSILCLYLEISIEIIRVAAAGKSKKENLLFY